MRYILFKFRIDNQLFSRTLTKDDDLITHNTRKALQIIQKIWLSCIICYSKMTSVYSLRFRQCLRMNLWLVYEISTELHNNWICTNKMLIRWVKTLVVKMFVKSTSCCHVTNQKWICWTASQVHKSSGYKSEILYVSSYILSHVMMSCT